MQSIEVSGFNSGVQKNKKPVFIDNDAFASILNAYVYRGECKKREGLQFIGRYRRVLTDQAQAATDGTSDYNIADILSALRATEPNAEIESESVVITLDNGGGNETEFTDQGNGLFLRTAGTAYQITTGTFINYITGEINLEWDAGGTPGAAVSVTISFNYFPALPAMGITTREIPGINKEQTIWFDTKYAYIHSGADFNEFLAPSGVTWNGSDSDFFWATNYRGSDSQDRLFFVTNFFVNAGSPMRYTRDTSGVWNTFAPIIGGTQQIQVLSSTLASGSAAYAGNLTDLPIVEGTVVISVEDNNGDEPDIIFRDTPKDGTLVSSGLNSGTINYATGAITLSFNPVLPGTTTYSVTASYSQGGNFLFQARILIPYYGRLVALNTYEGQTIGTSVNIYNRARFSQIGSPIQQDAWRSDVFGKGGFVDAPINEDIISATFYKNTLIVSFERSTWRLQYLGEYGIPFIWERISSDFGSESTFSNVLFDSGVLNVGDKAITGSSASDVKRIDLDIPDTVYDFKNTDNGPKRVHGIRDFRKELVFWCYPDNASLQSGQYFPNHSLLYNYRNNTFAFFRNSVTCFGNFQYPANITWDRLDVFWDDDNVLWDTAIQEDYPLIVSGNQQGFAHFYGFPDVETLSDSAIDANDQESLAVTAVSVASANGPITLTIPNHNLLNNEFIYLTGLKFLVTSTSTVGTSTLNDKIYIVGYVDINTITLFKWDMATQFAYSNFSGDITSGATYIGGGVVALFPRMEIRTKDFNPANQAGMNIKTSYIDFLFDVSNSCLMNVIMRMNAQLNDQGNLRVGNENIESCNTKTGYITGVALSNPCVIQSPDHCLLNGSSIRISDVGGTTQLNGNVYDITFLTVNTFSINVDATAFTPFTVGGYWVQETAEYFTPGSEYTWHRFFSTCYGQYLSMILTFNNDQMNQIQTHRQEMVLNAFKVWYRSAGKNIFGR